MDGFDNWLGPMPGPIVKEVKSTLNYSSLGQDKAGNGLLGSKALLTPWVRDLRQVAGLASLTHF